MIKLTASGEYTLIETRGQVKILTLDEGDTDLKHLELLVGDGVWQGYLLPTGLPTGTKLRNRIIPTKEIITKSSF